MIINNKSKQIHLRVTPEEHDAIAQKAQTAGVTISDFIRESATNGKICPIESINRDQWAKLAATTSNLNQITHLLHKGVVPIALESTLFTAVVLLKDVRKALIGQS